MLSEPGYLPADLFLITRQLDSHDLISFGREWSDLFRLDGPEIFLAENLDRKRRFTIDLVLDILSEL